MIKNVKSLMIPIQRPEIDSIPPLKRMEKPLHQENTLYQSGGEGGWPNSLFREPRHLALRQPIVIGHVLNSIPSCLFTSLTRRPTVDPIPLKFNLNRPKITPKYHYLRLNKWINKTFFLHKNYIISFHI